MFQIALLGLQLAAAEPLPPVALPPRRPSLEQRGLARYRLGNGLVVAGNGLFVASLLAAVPTLDGCGDPVHGCFPSTEIYVIGGGVLATGLTLGGAALAVGGLRAAGVPVRRHLVDVGLGAVAAGVAASVIAGAAGWYGPNYPLLVAIPVSWAAGLGQIALNERQLRRFRARVR